MSIGRNIKNLRTRYGLLQKDIANIAGVSNKTVSAWEKDRIAPRMGAIQKLADYFGLKKSDIIEPSELDGLEDTISVNSEETKLIVNYRELSDENKNFVSKLVTKLLSLKVAAL